MLSNNNTNENSKLKEWFQHNNIAVKIRQALEDVFVGQAVHLTFDGLQDGSCLIEILYNGETCTFINRNPPRAVIPIVEDTVEYKMEFVFKCAKICTNIQ